MLLKSRNLPIRTKIKISNAKMDLNLGDFIDYWIFMEGSYEEKWIKMIEKLVVGKAFIDIGANIGIYSLSLFKKTKYIYAFEPERENYKRLINNISINQITNIKAIKKAVSSKNDSMATLYVNKQDKGWSSLTMHHTDGKEMVQLITLDYFLSENRVKNIGLIKIDVEGAELEVIKGSLKTLQKLHPPVLIEFNDEVSKLSQHRMIDIYKLVTKYNYLGYRLKSDRLILLKSSEVPNIYIENILFIKKDAKPPIKFS